jgi:hypothetical protein
MNKFFLVLLVVGGALLVAGLPGKLIADGGTPAKPKPPGSPDQVSTDPIQALHQLQTLYGTHPQTDSTSKAPKSGRSYHVVLWAPREPTKPKYVLYIAGTDTATLVVAVFDASGTYFRLVDITADASAQADVGQIQQSL